MTSRCLLHAIRDRKPLDRNIGTEVTCVSLTIHIVTVTLVSLSDRWEVGPFELKMLIHYYYWLHFTAAFSITGPTVQGILWLS
jgi:hypothetical protein